MRSTKRANGEYKDHRDGQITLGEPFRVICREVRILDQPGGEGEGGRIWLVAQLQAKDIALNCLHSPKKSKTIFGFFFGVCVQGVQPLSPKSQRFHLDSSPHKLTRVTNPQLPWPRALPRILARLLCLALCCQLPLLTMLLLLLLLMRTWQLLLQLLWHLRCQKNSFQIIILDRDQTCGGTNCRTSCGASFCLEVGGHCQDHTATDHLAHRYVIFLCPLDVEIEKNIINSQWSVGRLSTWIIIYRSPVGKCWELSCKKVGCLTIWVGRIVRDKCSQKEKEEKVN